MNASVAIQVLPKAASDEELIRIVDEVIAYIKSTGLNYYVGPCETSIEGDYDELMEITLENSVARIDGSYAVAWSGSLDFTVEKVNDSIVSSIGTGEGLVNVYRGTGKILVAPIDDLGEEKAIENTSSSNANPDSQTASKAGTALKLINSFLDD